MVLPSQEKETEYFMLKLPKIAIIFLKVCGDLEVNQRELQILELVHMLSNYKDQLTFCKHMVNTRTLKASQRQAKLNADQ
jgi:hypothetical protein